MSYVYTLAELKTAVQNLAELNNSADIDGDILLQFVNDALLETREILIDADEDYYTTSGDITTVAGTTSYSLPTEFQRLRKVEVLSGSEYVRLRKFDLSGSSYFGVDQVDPTRCRYRLQESSIVLAPPPNAATTLRVWYVPHLTKLAVDGDTVTFRVPLEYKLFLQFARLDCLDRQELDTTPADRAIARLMPKVIKSASGRDMDEPFYLDPRGAPRDVWDDEDEYAERWG